MLLHLTPKIFAPYDHVALVDVTIDSLNLHLIGGTDVIARAPYKNKGFSVCCRNSGRKAMDGILLETGGPVPEFDLAIRWVINGDRVITHRITYRILDDEFDAATEAMLFWYEHSEDWPSRWPDWAINLAPVHAEPVMNVEPKPRSERWQTASSIKHLIDTLDKNGNIIERREIFAMPTIERERLFDPRCQFHKGRMPRIDAAFHLTGE